LERPRLLLNPLWIKVLKKNNKITAICVFNRKVLKCVFNAPDPAGVYNISRTPEAGLNVKGLLLFCKRENDGQARSKEKKKRIIARCDGRKDCTQPKVLKYEKAYQIPAG